MIYDVIVFLVDNDLSLWQESKKDFSPLERNLIELCEILVKCVDILYYTYLQEFTQSYTK